MQNVRIVAVLAVPRDDPASVGPGNATLDIVIHKKGASDARRAGVPLLVTN